MRCCSDTNNTPLRTQEVEGMERANDAELQAAKSSWAKEKASVAPPIVHPVYVDHSSFFAPLARLLLHFFCFLPFNYSVHVGSSFLRKPPSFLDSVFPLLCTRSLRVSYVHERRRITPSHVPES